MGIGVEMKRGTRRKFKDLHDAVENATDEQFWVILRRIENIDLKVAGWFLLERIRIKDYTSLGGGIND